jgi:hypothetical protein
MLLAVTCLGCGEDNQKSDLADATVGPEISIHCAGLTPKGIGDTNIRVDCPPPAE